MLTKAFKEKASPFKLTKDGKPDKRTNLAKKVPLGRVGEAEEYADLVAFLCSARSAYITGTAINLEGGICPVV